jgi:hypothetical protein
VGRDDRRGSKGKKETEKERGEDISLLPSELEGIL